MSKPQEILELEKVYGTTLEETKDEYDIMYWENSNLYLLNDEQQIVGLNLANNKIQEIENLNTLINLQKLNISSNQIQEIKNLDNLINLQQLYISGNQIQEIKNLEKLKKLQILYIYNNQIQEIKNLDNLINLQILYIHNNQIQEIKNLDNLINLQQLYIQNNQIQEIKNLDNLINLQILYIQNNQIQEIKNLDNLINLQILYIHNNQIQEIKNLDNLINLQKLYISYNQIQEIKNLNNLINLQKLYISYNQIQEIDFLKSILKLPKLYRLEVDHNPFLEAEKLILKNHENHLDTIKSSLQKLEETQISIQLPVKVMLLGNHASGKSTLLTYFQTLKRSKVEKDTHTSTHVLSVQHSTETINYKLPKAIFYDFGGQDYYHGIYRAFFTQETVNLLVWHPKSNHNELLVKDSNTFATRNYRRDYWLAQLQYAFDKKNTDKEKVYDDPVLLIQTRADEDAAKENWQEAFLKHNIVDEFHISLNIDFESIKNEAALHYLNAAFWDTVKKQTSTKKEPEWYPKFLSYIVNKNSPKAISLDTIIDYYNRKVTDEFTLEDKKDAFRADLEQLSRKGLLLYYKEDKLLNDVAWLNPAATVEDIHKTILDKGNIKTKGRISKEAFKKRKIDPKIEQLLINEKVLFFDESSEEYIIPNYLPLTSEDDEMYDLLKFDFNKPTFVLKFEHFIPFGLINQLICHYGQNPEKKHYWRDQLIFTYEKEFKVWIQLDFSKLTISVSVKPKTAKDSKLSTVTQQLFGEILFLYWDERIPNVKEEDIKKDIDQMVSTEKYDTREMSDQFYKQEFKKLTKPDDLYISTDNEFFVHYNTLNNPEKTQESIPAFPLLKNDLDKTKPRTQRSYRYRNFTDNENIKKMKKIFISYSREDVDYKNELRKHLNMLKRFDVADNWSCEDITIGKWHDQIQKELEESDLVIFMLSINFFNSQYILEQEVVNTMNAIANGSDKKVYSIIVSDFPGLENFNKEDLDETQKSILKLGDYQYGMYAQEKSVVSGNTKERIISLKEASNRGIIDTQLTKIVTKIMNDIK